MIIHKLVLSHAIVIKPSASRCIVVALDRIKFVEFIANVKNAWIHFPIWITEINYSSKKRRKISMAANVRKQDALKVIVNAITEEKNVVRLANVIAAKIRGK